MVGGNNNIGQTSDTRKERVRKARWAPHSLSPLTDKETPKLTSMQMKWWWKVRLRSNKSFTAINVEIPLFAEFTSELVF